MNYLAHAYLSFNHPEILVGNMISDFVKGKKKFDYPLEIQKGIALHRAIDTFTDDHPVTKQAKEYLKPAVGLYAGAFIDVVYDHFLANDANEFTDASLMLHAADTYTQLNNFYQLLPDRFQYLLPYMSSQNWLYNYRSLKGTEQSFGGLTRRAAYLESCVDVFRLFKIHYNSLRNCYNEFFPTVKAFALQELNRLKNE